MALFGSPNAFLGIDIGTSTIKIVELVGRSKRVEVAAYAQASMVNMLARPEAGSKEEEAQALRRTTDLISRMVDEAGVSTDVAVAALPSSVVFSTMISMPKLSPAEEEKAVRFAARDVVPADLDEMVLGWSRLGSAPRMAGDQKAGEKTQERADSKVDIEEDKPSPVFLTAAPKRVIDRYLKLAELLKVQLIALEVETFPLVRSLLSERGTGMIIDTGDRNTTFHLIDNGAPRVSHTIDHGGRNVSADLSKALSISMEEAERRKIEFGITEEGGEEQQRIVSSAVAKEIKAAKSLIQSYETKERRKVGYSVLIGGGANMRGLRAYWEQSIGHPAVVGNPWKGLSYPQELENVLYTLGPTYGVAVGLAQRGFKSST